MLMEAQADYYVYGAQRFFPWLTVYTSCNRSFLLVKGILRPHIWCNITNVYGYNDAVGRRHAWALGNLPSLKRHHTTLVKSET